MNKRKFVLFVTVALIGLALALSLGAVGQAANPEPEKFTVKVIGALTAAPCSFCPLGADLFGFSGDVFSHDGDPESDAPIGTYDACVQSFTGNPFDGGGRPS